MWADALIFHVLFYRSIRMKLLGTHRSLSCWSRSLRRKRGSHSKSLFGARDSLCFRTSDKTFNITINAARTLYWLWYLSTYGKQERLFERSNTPTRRKQYFHSIYCRHNSEREIRQQHTTILTRRGWVNWQRFLLVVYLVVFVTYRLKRN